MAMTEWFHPLQNSKTEASQFDAVQCHTQDTLFWRGFSAPEGDMISVFYVPLTGQVYALYFMIETWNSVTDNILFSDSWGAQIVRDV